MKEIQPLTEGLIQWFEKDRLIKQSSLEKQRIGRFDLSGRPWIVIPIFDSSGEVAFCKLKRPPGLTDKDQPKAKVYPHESKDRSAMYCRNVLKKEGLKRVVLCEGELDAILLNQYKIPAVSGTAGATTFPKEWLDYFPENIEVVVCMDADEAGRKASEKIGGMFKRHRPDVTVSEVVWMEGVHKGYDVTDFFVECVNRDEDPADRFWSLVHDYQTAKEQQETEKNPGTLIIKDPDTYERPIVELHPPDEEITIEEWREVIKKHFPELASAAEVCLSTVVQLLISNVHNCFSLTLVDVPSSGKTICLNFFDGIDEIMYASDNFTPASLVSGAANRSAKQLSKVDMLPRIRHKVLIVREMATILSEREDDLREKMGMLIRVLDGEGLVIDNGVHGRRGYQGDYLFMMLSASTPFPLRVWKAMGSAGHRMFMLSMNSNRPTVQSLIANRLSGDFKTKEKICKKATHDLIRTLWDKHKRGMIWDPYQDHEASIEIIAHLADFLAKYRGEIIVFKERYSDDRGHTIPLQEMSHRIFASLSNLAQGHALACGRQHITEDDIGVVMRVVFDTAPEPRPAVLRVLLRNDEVDASKIMEALNCSRPKARDEIEKMVQLGIATPIHTKTPGSTPTFSEELGFESDEQRIIRLSDEFKWLGSKEFKALYAKFGIQL